jgi:hypothetical protein
MGVNIMDFQLVSERITVLRIRMKFYNIRIINIHVLTEEKGEHEKDTFEQECRNHRREADKICRWKKRVAINERLQQIEDVVNSDLVWVYKEVNTFKRGFVPRTNFIRREKGKIVSDLMGIKNRWREYFNRLLKPTEQETEVPEGNQRSGRDVDDGTEEIEPPTEAEGHEAIRSLKNNKAPGIGELLAELFKGGERIAMGWTCTPDAELQEEGGGETTTTTTTTTTYGRGDTRWKTSEEATQEVDRCCRCCVPG